MSGHEDAITVSAWANLQRLPAMNTGNSFRQGMGFAMRMGIELVVATCLGLAMGYALDVFFGTRPWLMVAGLLLGGVAGSLNVYRIAQTLSLEDETEETLEDEKKASQGARLPDNNMNQDLKH